MFVYISKFADNRILNKLNTLGLDIILLDEYKKLPSEVSTHADMLFFEAEGKVFTYKDYTVKGNFQKISHEAKPKYPLDIGLNILKVGKNIFAKLDFMAEEVKDFLSDNGYNLNNVKQGYAHCSTLVLNDNAIITSDKSIEKSAKNLGIDCLLIDNKNIKLDGLSCGFIGGASAKIGNQILFFGDIKDIPNYDLIFEFVKKYDLSIISIDNMPLTDYGSALIL